MPERTAQATLRIGIDARQVQDHFPGIGRYAFNLVRALLASDAADRFVVFYDPKAPNHRYSWAELAAPNLELIPVAVPVFSPLEQVALPWLIRRQRLDVFHSPYYVKPYLLPCPSVTTIHDAIPSHDPSYLPSRAGRLAYAVAMRLAIASSRLVIVDSAASATDLTRFFGVPPARLRVVPLAADEFVVGRAEPATDVGAEAHILYVGINKPHKNLARLIRAYARADVPPPLLIAGAEDPRFPEPRQIAAALGLGDRVRFLGRVDEPTLARLYDDAIAFAFPSLAEGFGLPVLEAMACDVPVLCSNISCLTEVAGDAALLVDPYDIEAMAAALRRIATDAALRASLRQRGHARVRTFSWRSTAAATLAAYREAAGR